MRIDLHLHTAVSDGSLAPADLVQAAHGAGLDVIAITDHDTAAGVGAARAAAPPDLEVIAGIEVSCTHDGTDIHILGYFIDPDHEALHAFAARAAERRRQRMEGMLARLASLGVNVTFDAVVAAAGAQVTTLGRPHLARALVHAGHVHSFTEAFDRYLADGGPAYLPTELLTPREAIELVHAAGGLAVWAHPPMSIFDSEIRRFVAWGLDGVECFRPALPQADSLLLETAARDLGLLKSGGSDWHGAWHGLLGSFVVRASQVSDLLRRGGVIRALNRTQPA